MKNLTNDNDTVSVRFPRQFHHEAKVGAAIRGMTLQTFIASAVQEKLESKSKIDWTPELLEFQKATREEQQYLLRIMRVLTHLNAHARRCVFIVIDATLQLAAGPALSWYGSNPREGLPPVKQVKKELPLADSGPMLDL